jgi:hypothetical protein
MSKQKRFEPPAGFIVGVHQNIFATRALAEELHIAPYVVANALDKSGFMLVADIMGISGDSSKVILLQDKGQVAPNLEVVTNESDDNNSADGGDTTEGTI